LRLFHLTFRNKADEIVADVALPFASRVAAVVAAAKLLKENDTYRSVDLNDGKGFTYRLDARDV
jgi:hypothetical protein